jgi:hypothetical protein
VQIVSIAALQLLVEQFRKEHALKTGCWIRSDDLQLLVYRIAKIIQTPAPGEKVYRFCDESFDQF